MRCDTVWKDARLATLIAGDPGIVDHGIVAAKDGDIIYAGPAADAPMLDARHSIGCDGRWITPGLIDCHTHLIHAGNRAHEFELRLAGASYEQIARAGGGIVSTMHATRAATQDGLVASALPRLDALLAEGVTTVEVKSGYGLDIETELRMLRAARQLGEARAVRIATTFLGAHALPPEYADDADGYIAMLCDVLVPRIVALGLADAVDGFCEGIGFTPAQIGRLFAAAASHKLPVKLHAEQLSNSHGARLAADHRALSADHLEYLDEDGIAALARSGTVATVLPGAFYFMNETRRPPIDALRDRQVPIALATDCNPGTSPLTSILLVMNRGATLFHLTVEECLAGVTRNAARALGLGHRIGTLEAGKRCDLAIWDIERPAELVYRMGYNPLHARIWSGQ
ncbi:MAG: imidazolonepropionase [Novosphingobium sp.]|nr:imidazolonepropionase [Novosphingobium sp.]